MQVVGIAYTPDIFLCERGSVCTGTGQLISVMTWCYVWLVVSTFPYLASNWGLPPHIAYLNWTLIPVFWEINSWLLEILAGLLLGFIVHFLQQTTDIPLQWILTLLLALYQLRKSFELSWNITKFAAANFRDRMSWQRGGRQTADWLGEQ